VKRLAGTIVDSSVLLDIFTADLHWGDWSQMQLTEAARRAAIVLNAVVLARSHPGSHGSRNSEWPSPQWRLSKRFRPPLRSSPAMPTPTTGAQEEDVKRCFPTS